MSLSAKADRQSSGTLHKIHLPTRQWRRDRSQKSQRHNFPMPNWNQRRQLKSHHMSPAGCDLAAGGCCENGFKQKEDQRPAGKFAMRRQDAFRNTVQFTCGQWQKALPYARRSTRVRCSAGKPERFEAWPVYARGSRRTSCCKKGFAAIAIFADAI